MDTTRPPRSTCAGWARSWRILLAPVARLAASAEAIAPPGNGPAPGPAPHAAKPDIAPMPRALKGETHASTFCSH